MNTFAIGSLPVHFSVAKLFTFRWQYTPANGIKQKRDAEKLHPHNQFTQAIKP